jgi:hypothetical protein
VQYKAVSPTELQLTIHSNLVKEAGWFDLVVKNPWPYNPDTRKAWATVPRIRPTSLLTTGINRSGAILALLMLRVYEPRIH